MCDLNVIFLEEFKRLDALLRDMYQSEKGVSNYIDNMKSIPPDEYRFVSNWECDLKKLIRLRHLRNQLTHDIGTLDIDLCTQEDVDLLREFYDRFINICDPLALLRKQQEKRQATASLSQDKTQSEYMPDRPERQKAKRSFPSGGIVAILVILFMVLCFFIYTTVLK